MKELSDYRRGRRVVSSLSVHLVFVTKCRRNVLSDRALQVVREAVSKVCADSAAVLLEMDGADDHVHLVVAYPPQVSISRLVNSLKGVSSRRVRKRAFPEVVARLWRGHLWSPSYFAVSNGDAAPEKVRQYLEDQRRPEPPTRKRRYPGRKPPGSDDDKP